MATECQGWPHTKPRKKSTFQNDASLQIDVLWYGALKTGSLANVAVFFFSSDVTSLLFLITLCIRRSQLLIDGNLSRTSI